jgi:hypothetical protein
MPELWGNGCQPERDRSGKAEGTCTDDEEVQGELGLALGGGTSLILGWKEGHLKDGEEEEEGIH